MRGGLPKIPYESRTNRYLRRLQEHRELLDLSERIAQETGSTIAEVANIASKLPGDPMALRGIPTIGRGITGAQPHTRPGRDANTGRELE